MDGHGPVFFEKLMDNGLPIQIRQYLIGERLHSLPDLRVAEEVQLVQVVVQLVQLLSSLEALRLRDLLPRAWEGRRGPLQFASWQALRSHTPMAWVLFLD